MTVMLRAEGLDKQFVLHLRGGLRLPVLRGIDLTVHAGECVALVGPSGAGKSTLLRSLYGNYRVDAGRIWVRHQGAMLDLAAAAPRTVVEVRAATLGYVSQFLRVVPRVSALDIVAEAARGMHAEAARGMHAEAARGMHAEAARGMYAEAARLPNAEVAPGSPEAARLLNAEAAPGSPDDGWRTECDGVRRTDPDAARRTDPDAGCRAQPDAVPQTKSNDGQRIDPEAARRTTAAAAQATNAAAARERRDSDAARAEAASLLRRLNIPARLHDLPPATFSGGEQQRVNLARGFIGAHKVLLLDEPTASLDAANAEIVVAMIREAKAAGVAIVGIFHDATVRDAVADRLHDLAPLQDAA